MAKKDFDRYYKEVENQYLEMLDNLKDFQEAAMNKLIEPERLQEIEANIAPIKQNYQRLSYVMYLLNKPTKKQKQAKYNKVNKKLIEKLKGHDEQSILKENENSIENLRKTLSK